MAEQRPPEALTKVMHIRLTESQRQYLFDKVGQRQVGWYVRALIDADRNGKRRRR